MDDFLIPIGLDLHLNQPPMEHVGWNLIYAL